MVIAERVHQRLARELNWTPLEKTHFVLSDESDFANGYATVININRSVLFMAPPAGVGGLEDFDNWLDLLITHEYTHVLHLDKAEGAPGTMRHVFGRFLLLFPNIFEPSWIIEGLATHKETEDARGIGRGQSNMFEMMMRMEVEQGIKPVSQVNLPITSWPSGGTRYLYGVYFMRFVAERYGEEKLQELVEEYSDNILPFFINTTFRRVFDKDVSQMWQEFEVWLNEKFQPQITALKSRTVETEATEITHDGYINQPVRVSGDSVYYIRNNGSHQPELVRQAVNTGIEVLTKLHYGADFDVNNKGEIIISQPEVCNNLNLYSDLYLYKNNELQRLTSCGRYQRAVWNASADGLVAVRHSGGRLELHQLDINAVSQRRLWVSGNDEIVSQIDASHDGKKLVAAIWRQQYGWNLELFDLETGGWEAITQNSVIQAYPQYSADGRSIFYSSEADGVYNLYRYDIDSGQHHQLSHLLGGSFQSSQGEVGGPLYYIGYRARGTDVFRLDDASANNPVSPVTTVVLNPQTDATQQFESREYSPWQSLQPRWWFPVIGVSEDRSEYGITTAGNDALGLHNYSLTAAYDFKNSEPLGSILYQYSIDFAIALSRDNNLFKNSNGDIERVRADETLQLILAFPHRSLLSSSDILLALSWERDRDVQLLNGATPAGEFNDNLFGLAWLYNNAKRYPLSISPNDGRRIRLIAEDSDMFNSDFTGQVYTLDWREYLRLGGEHVLSLRVLQGWGTDQPSSFRLGGEDNGIDLNPFFETSGEGLFSRREYALRGYAEGLPQLRGRRAQIISAEYRFPIQRVERGLMAPPVGLMQWYGNLFIDSGAAYNDSRPDKYYTGAGIEFSADLNLFYLVPLTARIGYAHGFDEIGDDRTYFTLGASF